MLNRDYHKKQFVNIILNTTGDFIRLLEAKSILIFRKVNLYRDDKNISETFDEFLTNIGSK